VSLVKRLAFFKLTQNAATSEELEDMLIAFTAGLLLITVSELGDKTFFIALFLAIRYSRRLVFTGATLALAAMTIISVLLGQVASLLPKTYIHYAAIALFLGFGLKLLYDASQMPKVPEVCEVDVDGVVASEACEEQEEAAELVNQAELQLAKHATAIAIVLKVFTLTFVAEWGDRTQFATITLAAAQNPIGVTLGAILGHAICAAIAVIGGRFIAKYLSERWLTVIGGVLFLIFGAVTWIEGV
jgi:Ca2+/H+ antiporter, TMEM165/GDT1 family